MPLLRLRRSTGLLCVWMHDAFECVCLKKAVVNFALTRRAGATHIAVKTGMYLSGEWRMFLFTADLTIVFLSTVLVVTQFTRSTAISTHAYFTHSFAHHFLCCQNKKEEAHAHTAWHYFLMAKTAQIYTFSRSSLRLCQVDIWRASPLN